MILTCLVVLSSITTCLGEGYNSYYVPEQPQFIKDHYSDEADYGHHAAQEYDQGLRKHLENIRNSQAIRDYGNGENHGVRDITKQAHRNQGAHAVVHSSGGENNHVQQSHDKAFYEREKKYGYEKAYGYERETKHHDKGGNAHSHGSGYNHHENKGHHNQEGGAIRDLAAHGNRYKHGSESHGNKDILIDLSGDHNRGKDVVSSYNRGHKLRNLNLIPQRLRMQMPFHFKQNYINNIDGSLARFRHLSGIHGLGGIRGYELDYGNNPLKYGPLELEDAYVDKEFLNLRQPSVHVEDPSSNVYFVKHAK